MHFRHCIIYEFNQLKYGTKAAKGIFSVYGQEEESPGTPQNFETDELEVLPEENPRQYNRELANKRRA